MSRSRQELNDATGVDLALREEAEQLARQLFGKNSKKCKSFTDRLMDIYAQAQDKDFLLIHSPGGWGNTQITRCLQWERSIVEGISATLERMGYSWVLVQHLRSGRGLWAGIHDMRAQARFFAVKAEILATEVRFLLRHLSNLKIIMIAISQGAAFNNAVMQHLDGHESEKIIRNRMRPEVWLVQ